ncbi:MAG TPA: hypothetical protein PLE54_15840 [Burkholderiaceae bacterium]|nr:hypothetical protein [Burkholderiaceae bacterium]HQR72077.1 hypothetical protein [Burkholderiaceae bacterium]
MNRSRRLFVANTAGSAVAFALTGCGGSDGYMSPPPPVAAASPPPPPPPPAALSCGATAITGNHGHALSIPAGDVDSTVAVVYSILGTADHNHNVTLSAAQLAQIKGKSPVTVVSTIAGDGHTHNVTVNCA